MNLFVVKEPAGAVPRQPEPYKFSIWSAVGMAVGGSIAAALFTHRWYPVVGMVGGSLLLWAIQTLRSRLA